MPNLGAPRTHHHRWSCLSLLFGWKKLPDMARSLGRSDPGLQVRDDEMKKDGKPVPQRRLDRHGAG